MGSLYNLEMRIISRKVLREFWEQYPNAEQPLRSWLKNVKQTTWKTPADIKNSYRSASFLANNRVVFNIKGNHYRIVIAIKYQYSVVYIRFVGTHSEYDKIDATTV
ncbi:putative membrane protein [hydrothermal vent metagenome]|uniref:Putative membrane protein n=1 Tax=hydrothermal vent metagenome TaxID=652676 RepID=A0A3B0WF78_9ZZZZ